jgi:tellurium resistance protein TerD
MSWDVAKKDGSAAASDDGWTLATKGDEFVIRQKTARGMFVVGLGWDPAEEGAEVDVDVGVVLRDADGRMRNWKDFVYYANLEHSTGCAMHMGDNLTGEGEGDDEQIVLHMDRVPDYVTQIDTVVCIFLGSFRGQTLRSVKNCHVRLFVPRSRTDTETVGEKLLHFSLTDLARQDAAATGGVFCSFVRGDDGSWVFQARQELMSVRGFSDLLARVGAKDCSVSDRCTLL